MANNWIALQKGNFDGLSCNQVEILREIDRVELELDKYKDQLKILWERYDKNMPKNAVEDGQK